MFAWVREYECVINVGSLSHERHHLNSVNEQKLKD